mmetsp:Transcript_13273/g.24894  ORF Transcript_13273/g.24894 Transcript_13273/m.24894 type:complete len:107 (+) Transcript_13273:1663-1983(+)
MCTSTSDPSKRGVIKSLGVGITGIWSLLGFMLCPLSFVIKDEDTDATSSIALLDEFPTSGAISDNNRPILSSKGASWLEAIASSSSLDPRTSAGTSGEGTLIDSRS